MAVNISNMQLTVLNLPQVAHDLVPAAQAAQLANAQAPAIIRHQDQQAAETVQQTHAAEGNRIENELSGEGAQYEPSADGRRQPKREQTSEKRRASHPMGIGALVDIQI